MDDKTFIEELLAVRERMMSYALLLSDSKDLAIELYQEVSVRAYCKRATFRPGTRFDCWILAIMHNTFLNEVQRVARYNSHILNCESLNAVNECSELSPEYCVGVHEMLENVNSLPAPLRLPMKMRLTGYSYKEISEELSLPMSTVKNRIHAARVRLRYVLKDYVE